MKKRMAVFVLLGICLAAAAQNRDFVITGGTLVKYRGTAAEVRVPAGVTSIGEEAFSEYDRLRSITLPEGLTSIGDMAFAYCGGLTSVTLPEGVISIGAGAFAECESLRAITLPGSVTSIGDGAFYRCRNLRAITLPEGVTGVGDVVFYDCGGLASVTLPAGLTGIGESAFEGCGGLTSITLPAGLTSIGKRAFYGCGNLTSVTLPAGLTEIWDNTFEGCGKPPAIPAGVTVHGQVGEDVIGTWVDESGRAVVIINSRKELYLSVNFVRWNPSGSRSRSGFVPPDENGFYKLPIDGEKRTAGDGLGNRWGGYSIGVSYSVSGDGILTVEVHNSTHDTNENFSYEDTRTFHLRRVQQ